MMEQYTNEQAAEKALEWCSFHNGWKRICDIENSGALYKTWEELGEREQKRWAAEFGKHAAKDAWREFGEIPCKVPFGFIGGDGKFYKRLYDVPPGGLMMVFKVDDLEEARQKVGA